MNKVVARFANGRMVKGVTSDFLPGKEIFHVSESLSASGSRPVEVRTQDLKALFFVRDLAGSKPRSDRNAFDPGRATFGRRIRVTFKDGEILVGTTQAYQPGRPAFFVVPASSHSNNERCYVVATATQDVRIL